MCPHIELYCCDQNCCVRFPPRSVVLSSQQGRRVWTVDRNHVGFLTSVGSFERTLEADRSLTEFNLSCRFPTEGSGPSQIAGYREPAMATTPSIIFSKYSSAKVLGSKGKRVQVRVQGGPQDPRDMSNQGLGAPTC